MSTLADGSLRVARNVVPSAYRGVAVSHLEGDLSDDALVHHFLGRESYRRTRFVVVRGAHGHTALLHVGREDPEPLFAPITSVEVLSGPRDTAFVVSPQTDTAVPSSLAKAAVLEAPGAKAVVVQGRYEHVSFIVNPDPIRLIVLEVVPPRPAKLADQVRRLLDVSEDLVPMIVEARTVDLEDLALQHPADAYLLPCRGSDATIPGASIAFLDERPEHADGLLIGCERSRQIYRWFYGADATCVDICPRRFPTPEAQATLTKCCLLEFDIEVDTDKVVVPWGASLDQVREALDRIAQSREPEWSAV